MRDVWNDAQRAQFVRQLTGRLLGGARGPVLERTFEYWNNVDPATDQQIEHNVRSGMAPKPAEGMGED